MPAVSASSFPRADAQIRDARHDKTDDDQRDHKTQKITKNIVKGCQQAHDALRQEGSNQDTCGNGDDQPRQQSQFLLFHSVSPLHSSFFVYRTTPIKQYVCVGFSLFLFSGISSKAFPLPAG